MKNLYQEDIDLSEKTEDIWLTKRRSWLKLALIGSVGSQLPWMVSCENTSATNLADKRSVLDGKSVFTQTEMEAIYDLQNILLPPTENGPAAADVNAHSYLVWNLENENFPADERQWFIKKIKQLNKLSKTKFGNTYNKISKEQQFKLVANNIGSGWTQSYFSKMITIISEAIVLDPIYGVNTNEIGWKWLQHIPGTPRPSQSMKYPEILKKING